MGTIVGIRVRDGIALAADRRATDGSTIRSESLDKLVEFDAAGTVAAGAASAIQTFGRKLEGEVRRRRTEQGTAIRIDPFARLASDLANETGVETIVAARDGDGTARIRAIDATGGELEDGVLARGTGAQLALGNLESVDRDVSVEEVLEILESALERIAERDARTGEEIDVWTLEDE